jgi:hypothetical protein
MSEGARVRGRTIADVLPPRARRDGEASPAPEAAVETPTRAEEPAEESPDGEA